MKEKIEKLEALVKELGLSQEDLEHWVSERLWYQWVSELFLQEKVAAPLPLVYCDGQELFLSSEWIPEFEDMLFGFVAADKIIVSLTQNLPSIEVAQKMTASLSFHDGGLRIADKASLQLLWTPESQRQVYRTLLFLRRQGVAPDRLNLQAAWCFGNGNAEHFTLRNDLFAQDANVLMLI